MRRVWMVAVLALLAVAACGRNSMLGPDLERDVNDVNAAITRGELENACARLPRVTEGFATWVEGARGERAAVGNQLLERIAGMGSFCGAPPQGDPGKLAAAWPPI